MPKLANVPVKIETVLLAVLHRLPTMKHATPKTVQTVIADLRAAGVELIRLDDQSLCDMAERIEQRRMGT
jgi:hypothetical protein